VGEEGVRRRWWGERSRRSRSGRGRGGVGTPVASGEIGEERKGGGGVLFDRGGKLKGKFFFF
jgi:hypothetical protein